eukprot:m.102644 g.102644  ORF g.102644 m.102644 type:complete len:558 (+) comp14124_c0_seq5:93-1766(+)
MEEEEVVAQFQALQQRCRDYFGDLRALPHFGRHQWQGYFVRVFEAFTQLWKMQQQHRKLLETRCGLSRAQVGDMASKIGQLYYHFYLRTSEVAHLRQSYSFYKVLHDRNYFDLATADAALLEKIVRALARYAVVSVLLGEWDTIDKHVLPSFTLATSSLVSPSASTTAAAEARIPLEWAALPTELTAFVAAARASVGVVGGHSTASSDLFYPQSATAAAVAKRARTAALSEAVIVSLSAAQVRFSEVTLDMYRMLRRLEHRAARRVGPHKYLLHQPLPSELLVVLAATAKELSPASTWLCFVSSTEPIEDGVLLRSELSSKASQVNFHHVCISHRCQSLSLSDLTVFLRHPGLLILDAPRAASALRDFEVPFGTIVLASGDAQSSFDRADRGGLLTLFLADPLHALFMLTSPSSREKKHPPSNDSAQALLDLAEAVCALLADTGAHECMCEFSPSLLMFPLQTSFANGCMTSSHAHFSATLPSLALLHKVFSHLTLPTGPRVSLSCLLSDCMDVTTFSINCFIIFNDHSAESAAAAIRAWMVSSMWGMVARTAVCRF